MESSLRFRAAGLASDARLNLQLAGLYFSQNRHLLGNLQIAEKTLIVARSHRTSRLPIRHQEQSGVRFGTLQSLVLVVG